MTKKNKKCNFSESLVNQGIPVSRVHATLHPALSVGRSVGRLVGWSPFYFFYDFISFGHFRSYKSKISHFKSFLVILNVNLARDL